VQASDAHQVGNACVAEQVPVVAVDRRLVTHRQRGQHAGGLRIADTQHHRVADRLAGTLHRVAGVLGQDAVKRAFADAHRAAGADALLEEPQRQVETVRVEAAVRLAQARGQRPALAGAQVGRGLGDR